MGYVYNVSVDGDLVSLTIELEVARYKRELYNKPKRFTTNDALELLAEKEGYSSKELRLKKNNCAYNDGHGPNKATWIFLSTKKKKTSTPESKPQVTPESKPQVTPELKPTATTVKKVVNKEKQPPKPQKANSTMDALRASQAKRKK